MLVVALMTYPNYPTDRLVEKTVRKLNGEGVYTRDERKKARSFAKYESHYN